MLPCRITLDAVFKRMCQSESSESMKRQESELTADTDLTELSEELLPNSDMPNVDEINHEEEILPPLRNFLLTLLISGIALFFAILIPNISILFGLMGGSASACICFIMPSLFYLKTHEFGGSSRCELIQYVLVWCLLVGGFVIGVLGTAVTIYSLIYEDRDSDTCS